MNYKAVIYSTTVGGSSSRTGMVILFKFLECLGNGFLEAENPNLYI
jgi:hypothetical protein